MGGRTAQRQAVLDIGSNTANLLVTDADGGLPLPALSWKMRTGLSERLAPDGTIPSAGRKRLVEAVGRAAVEMRRARVDVFFAYATASVRDAPNRDRVLAEVEAKTGIRLGTLTGLQEAQLTFLAARRWLGWCAGPMLLLDIGGGTLEVAFGRDRLPDSALSLPLGAGRLTREFLRDGDPPSARAVRNLRRHVREQVREIAARGSWESPRTAVAASKTFQQLARLTGSAPLRRGPFEPRDLRRQTLRPWIDKLAATASADRQRLPGVSAHRARQILAGAVVGYEVMRGLDVEAVRICPWGLREGILLRRLESEPPEPSNAQWRSRTGSSVI
ncbi:Ppx/GppA family phosphatase [Actinoplanes sp. NPDC051859]|uniref:Ppx/GppA phosphatase family protein n=1 Tax=Actinoplanes sp. NPDC051859 TaxID=3363909 RepID=UPI00378FB075